MLLHILKLKIMKWQHVWKWRSVEEDSKRVVKKITLTNILCSVNFQAMCNVAKSTPLCYITIVVSFYLEWTVCSLVSSVPANYWQVTHSGFPNHTVQKPEILMPPVRQLLMLSIRQPQLPAAAAHPMSKCNDWIRSIYWLLMTWTTHYLRSNLLYSTQSDDLAIWDSFNTTCFMHTLLTILHN
jgi:hypothetical protein